MEIIDWNNKYGNMVNKFICSILVEELEYEEHRDEILSHDFNEYHLNGGHT